MSMDLSEQYDKIYRYCYYKLRHRETAEDVTQETFLRFLRGYPGREQTLPLLYTIARNLCADEFRRRRPETGLEEAEEAPDEGFEDTLVQAGALKTVLAGLTEEDRELLLLRYANEVPPAALCRLYGLSRFALYRRCRKLLTQCKQGLEEYP